MGSQWASRGEDAWRLLKSDQQKGQVAKSPKGGEEFKLTAIKKSI